MKYQKLFKAYKFYYYYYYYFVPLQAIYCKRKVTQCSTEAYLIFSPKMLRLFEGGA